MGKIKQEERIKIWNKFDQHCAYCGCVLEYNKMQVDHIEPVFRGSTQKELEFYGRKKGANKMYNYNPSCAPCNSSKSTFSIEDWRRQIKLKKDRIIRDSSTFRLLRRFGIVEFTSEDVIFYFEKEVTNG